MQERLETVDLCVGTDVHGQGLVALHFYPAHSVSERYQNFLLLLGLLDTRVRVLCMSVNKLLCAAAG